VSAGLLPTYEELAVRAGLAEEALARERGGLPYIAQCTWCGHLDRSETADASTEAMGDHMLSCEKAPYRLLLAIAAALNMPADVGKTVADIIPAIEEAQAVTAQLLAALKFAEQSCPCGARPESPNTHPHVVGCVIGKAIAKAEGR
jgi:hypothetical protein